MVEWTWCHCWVPSYGAIVVCYGWGEGDDQPWLSGGGAIAECHCSALWLSGRGAIAGCHCSLRWLGGG